MTSPWQACEQRLQELLADRALFGLDDHETTELEDLLASHPAQWMVWEGEPLVSVVARLDDLGLSSVVFDPCGNRPDEGDFLSVMESNVGRLEAA